METEDSRILSFVCANCTHEHLPDEMYASLYYQHAIICHECRMLEESEIFEELGDYKLNELINRYGSKLDYQTEADIPSKSYRYNTFEIEDLKDKYYDEYDEQDR